jgi:dienelactone hydrolase
MNETEAEVRTGEREVAIPAGRVVLEGELDVPVLASGVVVFVHGSGSSRHSRRNQFVEQRLQEAGLATLLMDLLTMGEEREDARTAHLRFDIGLLAQRVVAAMKWLAQDPRTHHLPIGCFGASTGGGAALVAAAERPESVKAIVSRGGRPDLAGNALSKVQAPTLLIVGSQDTPVIAMNRTALAQLSCLKSLEIVPGATHLFEEPGTLEAVATLAAAWFTRHLTTQAP